MFLRTQGGHCGGLLEDDLGAEGGHRGHADQPEGEEGGKSSP